MDILIVDDHVSTRMLLTDVLEHAGYALVSAANGHDALTYLHSTSVLPGLILRYSAIGSHERNATFFCGATDRPPMWYTVGLTEQKPPARHT